MTMKRSMTAQIKTKEKAVNKFREDFVYEQNNEIAVTRPDGVEEFIGKVWDAATKARDEEIIEKLQYNIHKEDDKDINSYAAGVNEGVRCSITSIRNLSVSTGGKEV